ncbi:MAG: hypothetical protein ACKO0V_14025 [bacterium]
MWFNESAGPDPYKSHCGRKTSISNRHKHGVRQFDDQRAGERGGFLKFWKKAGENAVSLFNTVVYDAFKVVGPQKYLDFDDEERGAK